MTKFVVALVVIITLFCLLYWLVLTPKTIKLQPALVARDAFDFETSLLVELDPSFPKALFLRRVRDSQWETSGDHTNYERKEYLEPSMSVSTIKPDAYLKESLNDPARILIGRFTDRGAGMHGWHVTMIRQGKNPIFFDRHQRYYVWIERDFPTGFDKTGNPVSTDSKRWYFAGLADVIAKESYHGYVEPSEEDR